MTPGLPSTSALLALDAIWGCIPSWPGVCLVCALPWRDPSGSRPCLLTWTLPGGRAPFPVSSEL